MNKSYLSTRTSYRCVCCLVCNHVPHPSNRAPNFATHISHFLLEMYLHSSLFCYLANFGLWKKNLYYSQYYRLGFCSQI